MEIINMTSEDIGNLKKLSLNFFNAKGDLLLFRYNNVLRLLKTLDDFTEDDFQKHFNAVSLLVKYRDYLPSEFVIPDFLVRVDNIIKFFAINYVYGNNLSVVLKDDNVSLERKKNYLKRIGIILRQMENIRKNTELKNFYLADIHEDNFIVDKAGVLRTIDLDGGKFSEDNNPVVKYLSPVSLFAKCNTPKYKIDMSNPYFASYIIDENTDIYCYSIVILNYLYNGKINGVSMNEFYDFLTKMSDIGIDKELIGCFERLFDDRDNVNPCDYIDTLTPGQIKKLRIK